MPFMQELQAALKGEREPHLFAPQKKEEGTMGRLLDTVDKFGDMYRHRHEIKERWKNKVKNVKVTSMFKRREAPKSSLATAEEKATEAQWWSGGTDGVHVGRGTVFASLEREDEEKDSSGSSSASEGSSGSEDEKQRIREEAEKAMEEIDEIKRPSSESEHHSEVDDEFADWMKEDPKQQPELAVEIPEALTAVARDNVAADNPKVGKEGRNGGEKRGKKNKKDKSGQQAAPEGRAKAADPWAEQASDDDWSATPAQPLLQASATLGQPLLQSSASKEPAKEPTKRKSRGRKASKSPVPVGRKASASPVPKLTKSAPVSADPWGADSEEEDSKPAPVATRKQVPPAPGQSSTGTASKPATEVSRKVVADPWGEDSEDEEFTGQTGGPPFSKSPAPLGRAAAPPPVSPAPAPARGRAPRAAAPAPLSNATAAGSRQLGAPASDKLAKSQEQRRLPASPWDDDEDDDIKS